MTHCPGPSCPFPGCPAAPLQLHAPLLLASTPRRTPTSATQDTALLGNLGVLGGLRGTLQHTAGGHVPLARLLQHAHAIAAACSGGPDARSDQHLLCGSTPDSWEAHAHLRALPLLMGCYLGSAGLQQVRGWRWGNGGAHSAAGTPANAYTSPGWCILEHMRTQGMQPH